VRFWLAMTLFVTAIAKACQGEPSPSGNLVS